MDNTAFFNLSYGVYLCTTWDNGRPTGCVANSAMQITANPATIAVSINHENYTHKCIKDCGYFAMVVLAEDSDPKLIGRFGFMSGEKVDKFDGTPYSVRGKLPVPDGGLCYFVCKVISTMETTTHTVFLGEVLEAENLRKGTPMTYAYYHKVLKGKTSAKAPTYVAEEPKEEVKYVCSICSYEYNGDVPFEELPDDWVCPLCGMGKEFFQKVGADGKKVSAAKSEKWVCKVCGYVYDGDIPFEELPDDWLCPICGMGKSEFEKMA